MESCLLKVGHPEATSTLMPHAGIHLARERPAPVGNRRIHHTYGVQMLVIKLILVAAVLFAFFVGITKFNSHCGAKFGHAFFTKRAFYFTATAIGVYAVGEMWRHSAQQSHGDTSNGIVLMLVGGLIAAWLVFDNVKRTDPLYGIAGSVVSLGLFSVLAWVWLPLMAIGLVCYFLMLMSAKPVYVLNR